MKKNRCDGVMEKSQQISPKTDATVGAAFGASAPVASAGASSDFASPLLPFAIVINPFDGLLLSGRDVRIV